MPRLNYPYSVKRKVRTPDQIGLHTCKFCLDCHDGQGAWQPLYAFPVDRAKADGLSAYCKLCSCKRAARKESRR